MSEEEILDYDENIYQKLTRATARVVDINLGKTTLADLLDGYTKSIVLQQKIDKAIEYIKENFDKTGICVSGSDLPYSYIEELLEILGGKENE